MTQRNTQERLRLYLIRHGEIEGAAPGKLLGWTDTALSERGLEQSLELAETLSSAEISGIYSSDLERTRVMAERIAGCRELKVQVSSAWREINMGEWEGRTMASLQDEAPELVARLFDDPASFKYPGGESFVFYRKGPEGSRPVAYDA